MNLKKIKSQKLESQKTRGGGAILNYELPITNYESKTKNSNNSQPKNKTTKQNFSLPLLLKERGLGVRFF